LAVELKGRGFKPGRKSVRMNTSFSRRGAPWAQKRVFKQTATALSA
jgi:hypothetical protein